MEPQRYSRDLHGYGGRPPRVTWPDQAVVAVQFVVNYEEGGENCLLHGDDASEAFLSEVVGAEPWPGQRHWNMESMYEYGARAGFWRLHDVFTSRHVPVTVYGVASALARSPAQVAAMQESDWEIASHGLKWIDYRNYDITAERADMLEAIRLHTEVTGERPRGWYTGRCSMNTIALACEVGNFDYVSDTYADDLPYWHWHGDVAQLMVPYTLDANDMRFATAQGFNSGEQFYAYLKDSFDVLLAEGRAGAPKMMSVGLHCRLAGRPGRSAAVAKFVDYVLEQPDVWMARRLDIATHWRAQLPPIQADVRPIDLDRDRFVALYGGIFEHSPWVADRAFDLEMGPAHNTAIGLHNLLCRAFRSATKDERLGVLQAHPDLAGRLAAAKRLTDASTREQASAGLDALTDAERQRFVELNQRYTDRFGFPFIMAVKNKTKDEILTAFETRIANERPDEFATACREVEKIARLRLEEILPHQTV
ncbi:MAG: allantoinase PuuE [Pseudomonadota bacterium]